MAHRSRIRLPRLLRARLGRSLIAAGPALGLIIAICPAAGASSAPRVSAAPGSGWYGYADTNSGGHTYSEVSGGWLQPAAKCTSTTSAAAFSVGLDGYTSPSIEQAGTLVECDAGTAHYYSWWQLYPQDGVQIVGTTVKPGDKITASVTRAGTSYKVKVTDATTPANSFTHKFTCAASVCLGSSAEWLAQTVSGSGGVIPIALFATWTVSGATVTSGSVKGVISTFPHVVINSPQTGPLNAKGNGFTVDLTR
jgi:hypothetical protein